MQNLLEELIQLLAEDERLVSEGKLLKNKVIELALNMDAGLIKLLLKNEAIKRHFFTEIGSVLVFDKIKFQRFVSNKQFLPDSYTAFKNKIGLVNENGDYLSESREVVLAWPYKDCVLEGGQTKEDQKRDEIFWNETLAPDEIDRLLAPKVWTNFKQYDKDGEHALSGKEKIDFSNENLIIKGNNLLALHSLYKRFAGKVKLIYIDPPYYFSDTKSGDTFIYNTNFKLSSWLVFMKNRLSIAKDLLAKEGSIFVQISDEGASHLKLLLDEVFKSGNFVNVVSVRMKNIAGASGGGEDKRLKKNIEFIYIYSRMAQCFKPFKNIYDYKELYELTQEYKENEVSWKYTSVLFDQGKKEYLFSTKDGDGNEIKIYKRKNPIIKSINQIAKEESISEKDVYYKYLNSIFTTAMPQSSIRTRVLDTLNEKKEKCELCSIEYTPRSGRNKGVLYEQFYKGDQLRLLSWLKDVSEEKEGIIYKKELQGTYWDGFNLNNLSKEGRVELENGKKPEALIERILDMATDKNDIILDYHLGSGTTCAVAHKMGRQYIGIEQLDYGENDSVVRLKNVINGDQSGISKPLNWQGGGAFIYCEIMEHNETYINRIQKAKTTKELLAIWEEMQEKAFISYKIDPKTINANISEFESLSLDEQKRFLTELLDKNQLYVNYSEIDDEDYKVSDTDKKLNRIFYGEK